MSKNKEKQRNFEHKMASPAKWPKCTYDTLALSRRNELTVTKLNSTGGGLVFELGYHHRKKNHIIRVVFQDQAMYAQTSLRGAKTCEIGKKGVCLVTLTNFGKDDRQFKKNACKNLYLGSIFIPGKYMFRVCFESPFNEDEIQPEIQVPHPPG